MIDDNDIGKGTLLVVFVLALVITPLVILYIGCTKAVALSRRKLNALIWIALVAMLLAALRAITL